MPLRGIVNTARALSYYTRRQEVAANNLANVSTDGFKGDRVFGRLAADGNWPLPEQKLDLRQGNLRQTGRPLDLALEGPGFLVVKTAQGDRLTRGGELSLDPAGMLVDHHGDPIQGVDGPLILNGQEIQIQQDGRVLVDGKEAGKLRMVNVADPKNLTKEAYGRFAVTGATTPAADAKLKQGALEEANVDSVTGLVDLISIQRAWAANTEALRAMDSVMGTVAGEIGKV